MFFCRADTGTAERFWDNSIEAQSFQKVKLRAKADIAGDRRRGRGADKRTEKLTQEESLALGGGREERSQS